ncbi:MAG: MATE family efflux transporter [Erysipelotrichaceae bacterium]|nr:MATE family efflux transporter [Erysipelotrichaceae bacterium]MDY5251942.1 MATE family efflux transporter [Erysipelotrichaceae bacterium]
MNKQVNLTNGKILNVLIAFTLPILFANLFQQLYNTIDTMIVGYYLGDNALAAMGSTASLFELLVGFATGVGSGFSVVIARYVGANDEANLKKAIAASICLGAILTLIIMSLSLFALKPLMHLLNTPSSIFEQAYSYLFVVCICVGITLTYNMASGILRAKGNSIIPLIALFISSILNIGLDILFIVKFKSGVQGAAIATVISQAISAALCLIYIKFKEKILVPNRHSFTIDKFLYKDLIGQGLSMGLMLSIVATGTVILQTAINKCGTEVIAGYIGARKVMSLFTLPMSALATALTTYVSQNYGAQNIQRIKDGVRQSNIMIIIWSIISIAIIFLTSDILVKLILSTSNDQIIYYGSTYLKISAIFFPSLCVLLNLRCSLQGLGQKIVPLFSSIIEMVGKLAFVVLLIPSLGFIGICITEPLIWVMMLMQLLWSYYHNEIFKKS